MLAAIRANDVNLPLFIHVFGAMLLTGGLFTVAITSFMGWRTSGDALGLNRLTFKTVLWAVFPAYILMRVGAQWTESAESLTKAEEESIWIGIGYITADLGALLVIVSIVLSIIGLKKLRNGNGLKLSRSAGIISALLLVAYCITIWAMTVKPV